MLPLASPSKLTEKSPSKLDDSLVRATPISPPENIAAISPPVVSNTKSYRSVGLSFARPRFDAGPPRPLAPKAFISPVSSTPDKARAFFETSGNLVEVIVAGGFFYLTGDGEEQGFDFWSEVERVHGELNAAAPDILEELGEPTAELDLWVREGEEGEADFNLSLMVRDRTSSPLVWLRRLKAVAESLGLREEVLVWEAADLFSFQVSRETGFPVRD